MAGKQIIQNSQQNFHINSSQQLQQSYSMPTLGQVHGLGSMQGIQGLSHPSSNLKKAQQVDLKYNVNGMMQGQRQPSKRELIMENQASLQKPMNFRSPAGFSPDRIVAQVQEDISNGVQMPNGCAVASSSYMKKPSKMNSQVTRSREQQIRGSPQVRSLSKQPQGIQQPQQNLRNSFNALQGTPQMVPVMQSQQLKQQKLMGSQSENKLRTARDVPGSSTPSVGSSSIYRLQKNNMFDSTSAIQQNPTFLQPLERQDLIKTPQLRGFSPGQGPNFNININGSSNLQNNININIINHNIQLNSKGGNKAVSKNNVELNTPQNMIQQYQYGRQQIVGHEQPSKASKRPQNGLVIENDDTDVEVTDFNQNSLPGFKEGSKVLGKQGRQDSLNKSSRRNIKSSNTQGNSPQVNSQAWPQQPTNQLQNELQQQQHQPRSFIQQQNIIAQSMQSQSNYNIKKYNQSAPPMDIIQDPQLSQNNASQQSNLLQNYNSAGSKYAQSKPSSGIAFKTNQSHLFNPIKKSFKGNPNNSNNSSASSIMNNNNAIPQSYQMQQQQQLQLQQQQQQTTGSNFNPQQHSQQKTQRPANQGQTPYGGAGSQRRGETSQNRVFKGTAASQENYFSNQNSNLIDYNLKDPIIKYAFKTRTGFIPNKPSKTNQDAYFILKNFGSIRNNWFFGVCDGHGINGHHASDHVKKFLPQNIEFIDYMAIKNRSQGGKSPSQKGQIKNELNRKTRSRGSSPNTSARQEEGNAIDQSEDSNNSNDIPSFLLSNDKSKKFAVVTEGFLKTSFDLRRRSFDVNFSGSTIVSVMVTGKKLLCANVGDSRAILGSLKPKNIALGAQETLASQTTHEPAKVWVAHALSRDHKPDCKDEKERILQCNGRIDTFREPNGDPIGPFRVWLKNENIPGLAMSRSIGDLVASSVGVSAEPEIYDLDLNEDDKFLVLASDGVWEFISNEEIVNMVVPFWLQNNPDGACEKITKESVAHWKKEDEVIDDITCVVIFMNIKG